MGNITKNKTWKKNPPHPLHENSKCFYQKLILRRNENEKVYTNIIEYESSGKKFYELEIQIPEEISITGMTINVLGFSYNKLDFDVMEKHAKKIINKLIK